MTTLVAILVFVAIFALAGILLARVAAGSGALFDLNSGERRAWFRRFAKPGIPAARLDKPTMPSATITSAGAAGSTTDSDKDTDKKSAGSTINQSAAAPIEQLIETVNASLPQTQCAQCGYPGCRPYAAAIVNDDVPINQCPPGGEALIQELAQLLGKPVIAMDAERGDTKPPQVAFIDEAACIGCTLCIAACPVDAIVGASRLMHTVLEDQCTGCELCLPPCPVDCIALLPADTGLDRWRWSKPA